jgi:hypothetical protein
MKINVRREIAMWALGLAWTGLGVVSLGNSNEWGIVQSGAILLVLLVPACLIVFSLRDRTKRD